MFKKILLLFILSSTILIAQNKIKNFHKSKKIMYNIYKNKETGKGTAFYSNCKYKSKFFNTSKQKDKIKLITKKIVEADTCGYIPRKITKDNRYKFIEAEHIVPMSRIASEWPCWKDGNTKCVRSTGKNKGKKYKGRTCCKKVSKKFNLMEADLYNLVPAIGEINRDRSNYNFEEIYGEKRIYGENVDFEINFKKKIIEPREKIRGKIARTYDYMSKTYKFPLTKKEKTLFKKWNDKYPETKYFKDIHNKIEKIQGLKFNDE